MMNLKYIIGFVAVFGLLIISCKKDEEPPVNPYNAVDYGLDSTEIDTLDKNSIASIHKDIFQPKCATPGCHDGTFEPDFSTVMSSYSSLVYHPIIKNNKAESFKYRVIPNNSANSVLYERISNCCFVNTNDRMPQDNIGSALPDEDIARVKKWIDDGAKDIAGKITAEPNSEPSYSFLWAIVDEGFPLVSDTRQLSHDTNRVDKVFYGAFTVDVNMGVVLIAQVEDDKTAPKDFKNGKLLFSYDKDNFSTPVKTVTSTFIDVEGGIWYNQFTTSGLDEGRTVYMRYYINDGDHDKDTEFPHDGSPDYYKGHWSMVVVAGSNN